LYAYVSATHDLGRNQLRQALDHISDALNDTGTHV
jgi:hypothetical protein